jgi:4-hydroxybenzoate polyprenyltransferase
MLLFFSFLLYAIPIDAIDVRLLLATFLITFSVYSLNKMTDIGEDTINLPYRSRFIAQHKRTIAVAVFGAVSSALLLALSHSVYAMLVISSPLIIGFLYSTGIAGFRLKQIKGLKSVVVALSWAFVATMLPLTVMSRGVVEVLLIFWFFFVKMFVNVTLFDLPRMFRKQHNPKRPPRGKLIARSLVIVLLLCWNFRTISPAARPFHHLWVLVHLNLL